MEYILMDPPFKVKSFKDMTKKEAKINFDWYLIQIPNRLALLEKVYKVTSKDDDIVLNYSRESLVKLWQWYINNVQIEEKSDELKNMEMENQPEWIRRDISSHKISVGWMAIAVDISIYFSELFIKEHETIKWGFVSNRKRLAYVNKPVLVGFKGGLALDSIRIISVLTSKIVDKDLDETALLKAYEVWEKNV